MKSIRNLLFFAALGFCCSAVADVGDERPAAVSLELLGRGLLYSVDFDYGVTTNLSVGAGISSIAVQSRNSDGTQYGSGTITIIPAYLNYYFYNSNGHRWFGTAAIDFLSSSFSTSTWKSASSGVLWIPGVGYEYRGSGGFLFRATANVPLLGQSTLIWPGFSFGYAF